MKKRTSIIVLLIAFSFIQCNTLKLETHPSFKIKGATYNYWVGGQPGISGIKVNIGYQSANDIVFETMYFQKRIVKIEARTVNNKSYFIGHFDTSTRKDMIVVVENTVQKPVEKNEVFPFELKENEVVIKYKQKGKTKYFKIKNLKKTKTDFYP